MARLILALCLAITLCAQSAERLYVVTHVDLMGPSIADGSKLLNEHATESRKDPGAVRFEVFVEPARRNHLTIVSVWESRAAFDKHSDLEHTRRFREKLQPMLGGPLDERLHILLP
ncbi:MAG: putative quinol monooxygenase [Acidobacteriota bacterium]